MTDVIDGLGVRRTVVRRDVIDRLGVRRTITSVSTIDGTGVRRTINLVGSQPVASPDAVSGYGYSHSSIQIITEQTTVTPNGGAAPFTYSWASVSGWVAVSPTSATTAFRSPPIAAGNDSTADLVCVVTDANGHAVNSNPVSAYATNAGPF